MHCAFIHWFPVLFTYDSNISYWTGHVGWWTTHVTCSLKGPWTKSLSYWLPWIAAPQTNHEPEQTKAALWSESSPRNWGTTGVWGLGKTPKIWVIEQETEITHEQSVLTSGVGGALGEGVGDCHVKQCHVRLSSWHPFSVVNGKAWPHDPNARWIWAVSSSAWTSKWHLGTPQSNSCELATGPWHCWWMQTTGTYYLSTWSRNIPVVQALIYYWHKVSRSLTGGLQE